MAVEQGDHVRILVIGQLNGNACNNKFEYACGADTGGGTLANMLTAFQDLWQANVIPNVVDRYNVVAYQADKLEGVIWKSTNVPPSNPPLWPAVKPLLRFSEQNSLTGDPVDDVGTITTAEMPSYVTVSVKKNCGPATQLDLTTREPLAKIMTGGIRFGGIPKSATDDAAGNFLNAASVTAWQAAATALRSFSGSGNDYTMEVWSLWQDRYPRYNAGSPHMVRATVTSLSLALKLGHMISRDEGRGE